MSKSRGHPMINSPTRVAALGGLTAYDASTDHFKLTYYDPPAGLEGHILTLFALEWDRELIVDRHAGALPQLFISMSGKGLARFPNHEDRVDIGPTLFSGFEIAPPFQLEGPWQCIGASLSPLGWAALTQAPADRHRNRFLAAGDLLGEGIDRFAQALTARYHGGEISAAAACHELAEWIRPRLRPIARSHEAVIANAVAWLGTSLNPPVEELFKDQPYSRRQVERLVQRYFGLTPHALARKFRAIRACSLLLNPGLTDEGEAEIAAAFHDQPHMIREIRRYCGHTPSRLAQADEPMFHQLLRMTNLERLEKFRKIGEPPR